MIKENYEKALIKSLLSHEEENILLLLKGKTNKKLFQEVNKNNMYLSFAIDLNLNRVVQKIVMSFPLSVIDQNKFLIKSYKKHNMFALKILLKKWQEDHSHYSFIREILSQKFIQSEEEIIKRVLSIKIDNKKIEYWLEYIELKFQEKYISNLSTSTVSYYRNNSLKWSDAFVEKLKMNCNESLKQNLKNKQSKSQLKI